MPRTTAEDQLQSFRFRLFELAGGAGAFAAEDPIAGFTTITTPEVTVEVGEYRTGDKTYARKIPGVVSIGDSVMTRGILIGDTTIFDWVIAKYIGKTPFRTDLEVRVYNQEGNGTLVDDIHVRTEIYREAIPTTVKPLGDLDAGASDINMQELTVSLEEIEMPEVVV